MRSFTVDDKHADYLGGTSSSLTSSLYSTSSPDDPYLTKLWSDLEEQDDMLINDPRCMI
jgi:hypothetical protein